MAVGGELHSQQKEFLQLVGDDEGKHAYLYAHSLGTAPLTFPGWGAYLVLVSVAALISDALECFPVRQKVYKLARQLGTPT